MSRTTITLTFSILSILFLASCSSSNVNYESDYNQATDFSKYKTFSWHQPNSFNDNSNQYLANDILDTRIRSDIETQLTSKGYELKASGYAVDFLVNYSVTTEDRMDIKTYNNYGGYAPGWNYGGYYRSGYRRSGVGYGMGYSTMPSTEVKTTYYTQGSLIIDVVNPKDDTLVWRGTAEGKLKKNQTTQERKAAIEEVVMNILSEFPPGA